MSAKTLERCRRTREYLTYAKHHPQGRVENGGNHQWKIVGPRGSVPMQDHPGEIPPIMRKVLYKQLAAIGLAVLIVAVFLTAVA